MKKKLFNILLALISVSVTYSVLEFLLIPVVINTSSLKTQSLFPPAMRILSQSSKESVVPRNYVLILGDSYAMGAGDWFESVDKNTNPPYHSAHVIHDLSGRDVISFGEAGAGSITSMAAVPVRRMLALKRFGVGMPNTILVYFYEGNDITDNIGYLGRHFYHEYDEDKIYDKNYFRQFLDNEARGKVSIKRYTDRLYLMGYMVKLYKAFKERLEEALRTKDAGEEARAVPLQNDPVNEVIIRSGTFHVPDHLQSPALELNRDELDLSLYVMEQSLAYLTDYFRGVDVHIVYVPSPLSSYEIVSDRVTVQVYEKDISSYPSEKVEEYHSYISGRVASIAGKYGAGFLDVTDKIREAGGGRFIHGPNDWKHFNETGYRILGEAVSDYLDNVK